MKSLLRLAVTNVHFKCNKLWYTPSDGLSMVASLAVILRFHVNRQEHIHLVESAVEMAQMRLGK